VPLARPRCPPGAPPTRVAGLVLAVLALPAAAGDRLLGTGGVTQVEGAAGGGLVPWGVIAGLGTDRQSGASAFCTRTQPDDFRLDVCGVAVGIRDRVELSVARQDFDLGTTVPGESIRQDVWGLKVRLLGDAVFDQDRWWPQLALGLQYKRNRDYDFVPALLGARDNAGLDLYLAATKVYLAGLAGRNVVTTATLRATRANQLGLLGFGGDRGDSYRLVGEFSAGVFVTDHLVAGLEYRQKPDLLSAFPEDDFWDAWVAWIPVKNVSVTGAWVDFGQIADKTSQSGWYLSLQAGF
jgi:hypothetical protein